MKLGAFELNQIYTGDARELANNIPDESVDLIFADPVYQNIEDYVWLSELAYRVLKPNSACLMWQGQQWLEKTIVALSNAPLSYRWILGWYASNNMQMVGKIGRKIAPCLWYEKGHSNPFNAVREVVDVPIPVKKAPFKWAKNPKALSYYLTKFVNSESIVLDPFSGMGSLPAVCKTFGVKFIAFEIDGERADQARQRLIETPEPFPFLLYPDSYQGRLFEGIESASEQCFAPDLKRRAGKLVAEN